MPENEKALRSLQYIPSNNFSHGHELCMTERRNFDVLSFESNSYDSQIRAPTFTTPVVDGNSLLPVLDAAQPRTVLRIRVKEKRKLVDRDVVVVSLLDHQDGPLAA